MPAYNNGFMSFAFMKELFKRSSKEKLAEGMQDQQLLLILFMLLYFTILKNLMTYQFPQLGYLLVYYVEES